MSVARSAPGKNETMESSIINVSFDETLCPYLTHSTSQTIILIITRSITLFGEKDTMVLEGNLGTITLEGNLGGVILD